MSHVLGEGAALDVEGQLEGHRRELTAYCYRMLGSAAEAEDAVQETFLRAWRAADRFEGRSSVRSWLYRIASNVCIDMHRSPQRRARPVDLGPPVAQQGAVPGPELPEATFLGPVADATVLDPRLDPAEAAAVRESIRLAFVASLQLLPPRQRAALILCEVLRWPAAEVAELLESSTASVNSALQRARATLAARRDEPLDPVDDPAHAALLARYVDAYERYDMAALAELLRADAVITMPPYGIWLRGRDDVIGWMTEQGHGCRGSRLVPIGLNGTAGFGSYRSAGPGRWEPWALQVIEVAGGQIVGHHNFLGAAGFAQVGLPPHLEA